MPDTSVLPRPLPFDKGIKTYSIDDRSYLSTIRYSHENEECFGVRLQHAHAATDCSVDRTIQWTTDVCFSLTEKDVKISVNTIVGRSTGIIGPIPVGASRPSIVKDVVKRWGARQIFPIKCIPDTVSTGGFDSFLSKVLDSRRRLPVLFISAKSYNDRPIVDAYRIANLVVGLCHVHVADSRFPSMRLRENLGNSFNCWDGAIRIYWPRFAVSDSPYYHRLWVPSAVEGIESEEYGFANMLLGMLNKVSATQSFEDKLTWRGIEGLLHRQALLEAKARNDVDEMLGLAFQDIETKDGQIRSLEEQLEQLQEDLQKAQGEAEAYRLAFTDTRRAKRAPAGESSSVEAVAPTSVAGVIEKVKAEYPSQIVFSLNSRSEVENNDFEDCAALYDSFRFLATIFRDAKSGRKPCPDLDLALKELCGFSYEPHQSEVTLGQFKEYYRCTHGNETIWLKHHLQKGKAKDSRFTIRTAFEYDEDNDRVIVGYIGQHQRTRAS